MLSASGEFEAISMLGRQRQNARRTQPWRVKRLIVENAARNVEAAINAYQALDS